MGEKILLETISRRRAFSLFGLAAALGLAAPASVLTASDAEAQTPGMDRREERREERHERREGRREERHERRAERREGRHERREERREGRHERREERRTTGTSQQ